MNQQFKNIKVHVPTPKISEMVQKKLFEMGLSWSHGKSPSFLDKEYIFISDEEGLSYGTYLQTFEDSSEKQVHYLQILTENLEGVLFTYKDDKKVYYLVGYKAYWVNDYENKISSTDYELNKYTTILDVNEKEIEMKQDNNEMPKLEAGKHAVKTKNGVALVVEWGGKIAFSYLQGDAWDDRLDIVECVYTLPHPKYVLDSNYYPESNLIWPKEDESKEQARLEYDNLQAKISESQEQISKLQEQANNLRKTLQL